MTNRHITSFIREEQLRRQTPYREGKKREEQEQKQYGQSNIARYRAISAMESHIVAYNIIGLYVSANSRPTSRLINPCD